MCLAITAKNKQCKNAGYYDGYCYIHRNKVKTPDRGKCKQLTSKKLPCKLKERTAGCGYCHVHSKKCAVGLCHGSAVTHSRNGNYCEKHRLQYKFEPENCAICFEPIDQTIVTPLLCGHWFHKDCLKKWNKPQCSLCKKVMSIQEQKLYIKPSYSDMIENIRRAQAILYSNHLPIIERQRLINEILGY